MILDKKVSCFNSYSDTIPKDVILLDFLTSTKYKDEVIQIRNATNKKIVDTLKSKLPAITPSGLFEDKRTAKNLKTHSGFICVDIDKKDNLALDMAYAKSLISQIEQVAFASYSVSGNGIFALIPIEDPVNHKAHFYALEQDFKKDFDIIIDKSCKDVSRLRGYSYDPDAYLNHQPKIYTRKIVHEKKTAPKRKISYNPKNKDSFDECLKAIERYAIDITGDNEQWFSILCAIANEYGETGRQLAHFISQYSSLYEYDRLNKDYTRALQSNYGYGMGTFYHYFKSSVIVRQHNNNL
ncbi:hypothetical protein AAT17_07110 [Nonlabens sp. MIC269]|uniref:BT4734/BF3469 family protein n=1 Tax=Nonlabens sp. MIC269 TaxID=1476901 RepID=UPI000721238B|nr:BT4734/BF3469 family protein [Nonlabens sp. MIC269]ALM21007.1 hypothetical protein AAT17_07110 [Nonlabens sp. MIC269]